MNNYPDENENKKKKKKFNLFDLQRDGKGVEKDEIKDLSFINFFRLYGRNATRILNSNLMFTLFCLPIFFLFFGFAGFFDNFTYGVSNPVFAPILAEIELGCADPLTLSMYGALCQRTEYMRDFSTLSWIFIGLTGLLVFTWGYGNCILAYYTRNILRGEPIFFFADCKTVIKNNKFQGLILGIIDIIIIGVLFYDFEFFRINSSLYIYSVMFYLIIFIAIIYTVMRCYMYIMQVTFDLKLTKLIKNAFLFTFIGIKRNILAFIGFVLVIAFNIILFWVLRPLGVALPFVLTAGTLSFIGTYAAYPKIKEIMIDPYYKNEDGVDEDDEEEAYE